ncbi:MAG: thioredoxin domain-containing protein [Clostridium sp.]|nr:thioredoxin domain-containing protein [Clostridium sp.]
MKFKKFTFATMAAGLMALAACGGNAKASAENTEETVTAEETTVVDESSADNAVIELQSGQTLAARDLPVIIDFGATWCGPCRMFKPVYHAAAARNVGKAYFYAVDVDQFPDLARQYSVSSIPVVAVLYPDGTVRINEPGAMDEAEFDQFLTTVL